MSRPDKARLALTDERRLTAGYAHHRSPAFSRDGKLLAVAVGRGDDASWVVVDRRGRVARSLQGPAAGTASFAPDGSLAFERRFGATSEVWLTPGGDAPAVRLLGGDGQAYREPAFSPDGARLACVVADGPDARPRLLIVHLADGRRHEVGADPARADARPGFSPDGAELVFEGTLGDDRAIYALHLGRNELQRLTPPGELATRPTFVDGARVVYERRPAHGPSTLVLLDRERARAQVLVEDGASRGEPSCFVGGSGKVRIAYAAQPAPTPQSDRRAPPRFDVFVGKLRGMPAAGGAVP